MTFENDGTPRFASALGPAARAALTWTTPLPLTAKYRTNLAWQRSNQFEVAAVGPPNLAQG